jgi:hypothetical protein
MLNFKFLKWAALCGLLVFALVFGLSSCEDKDPCSDNSESEAALSLWKEGASIAVWDTESQRLRPPHADFQNVEIKAWTHNHSTFADMFYIPDYQSDIQDVTVDNPPYFQADSSYRLLFIEPMHVSPRLDWGKNVYQIPFTLKLEEYDSKDSICIIIREGENCETSSRIWEYYVNGSLVNISEKYQTGIILSKP